jgi:iron complex transport system substrate-binding protein
MISKNVSRILAGALTLSAFMVAPPAAQSSVRYAQNFEIIEHETHKLLLVSNIFRNSRSTHRYALVPRGSKVPELEANTMVILTPVERVVAMETVTFGYLAALDSLDVVIATGSGDFVTNPIIRKRIEDGLVEKIQPSPSPDIEQLLLLQPDLIIASALGDPSDTHPQLKRAGLPVLLSAGYMETHPLARAEWIKFMAALLVKDQLAEQIFNEIEDKYLKLKALTEGIDDRPTILGNAPYSGVWHVPGGDSFTARMIDDAGGDYLWREDSSRGGLPVDIERVFLRAAHADFWINPSHHRNMKSLLSIDSRFSKFSAALRHRVYNNTRQSKETGGNAIWEKGVVEPHIVLADLIHIFHPDLLSDHKLVYYERIK